MSMHFGQAYRLLLVIRRGKIKRLIQEVMHRIYSNDASYVLRRDLNVSFRAAPARLPITIRPIGAQDVPEILRARPGRLLLLQANIPTCYLAVNSEDRICYMQWLIGPDEQDRFKPFFKGEFRLLARNEVLLEFAYTFEAFRGQGIMGPAMAAIAEKGLELGARWAVTYVLKDNIAALKGCRQAGFHPYMISEERWRLFCFRQSFRSLPGGARFPFESEKKANRPERAFEELSDAGGTAAALHPSPAASIARSGPATQPADTTDRIGNHGHQTWTGK